MDGPDSREVLERFNSALDLVDTIARQLYRKLGTLVELDDLLSFGREGLLDAARRYDEGRGVPFHVYASFRVRGAAYDGVRRISALPRSLYQKIATLESQSLVSEGEVSYAFVREDSGPRSEHDQVLADHLAGMAMAATMGLIAKSDRDTHPSEHEQILNPEQEFAHAELAHQIEALLKTLDAEEHEIVRRHYFDGQRLEDIAQDLNISKSWASRLHTRALSRLAKRLPGNR